jgi:hypothetical protein
MNRVRRILRRSATESGGNTAEAAALSAILQFERPIMGGEK